MDSVAILCAAKKVKLNFYRKDGGPNGYSSVSQTWDERYTTCSIVCRFPGYEACEFYNPGGLEVIEGLDVNAITNDIWENNVSPSEGVIICESGQRIVWTLSNDGEGAEMLTLDITKD